MDASTRAPAPPPLKVGPVRAYSTPMEGTPQSADSVKSGPFSSDYYGSPTSTTSPLLWGGQSASGSGPGPASPDVLKRPTAGMSQRKVNANSYCGRHSDEFLFGGKGLGDLWRAVKKK